VRDAHVLKRQKSSPELWVRPKREAKGRESGKILMRKKRRGATGMPPLRTAQRIDEHRGNTQKGRRGTDPGCTYWTAALEEIFTN